MACAASGEGALEQATARRFDVVLCDVQLPGISGIDLTREIRADPELKQTIMIAVTSYAMSGDRERSLEVGCADYHTKPVEMAKLLGQIEAILVPGRK